MRFVIEIPDQLLPAAASGHIAVATSAADTFSGGAAQSGPDPAASALAADSAGDAEPLAGGVATGPGPGGAMNGGAAPNGS